ncbi:FAD-dependent oxidoreductase [Clostridium estertheticum]|uniref:NAD(P)/FAD-dependent oxidoreductase n=1 Tax=Clostridium estertheticum TaxID=238834 RepID=A0AA47I5V2_9CLOT|nr:FAD-dependent oxidoreductase [Clostridium estertheticum]MBU3155630.1 NAD(P)/FAD-dependent oxidoreductase [Clostridium estertheticum]WAG59978.1 NAD(P)/FAD-dependent oxidoreductase [Clostridium estertheticum]
MFNNLFSKGKIGSMDTKNRIVMTSMGNHLGNPDGTMSKADIAFYGARAKGGVGVIFTEVSMVEESRGRGNLCQISVADDKYIPGLKELADEIHKYNSKIVIQIYHPGRQGISVVNGNLPMLAPSAIECQCVHQPTVAMTTEEVSDMVEKFILAAVRVKKSGIDGVEVHGAHGYLVNQFLSPHTNHRIDKYGGSFENRLRFLEEIVIGIKERCGKDFPLVVRLSVDEFYETIGLPEEGLHLKDGVKIAERMEQLGVDAIDVSSGTYETMNTAWEPSSFDQGWKINLAETIKKSVKIPVIGVSVIRDPEYADQIIADGKVDFVGSARQHFGDPEWSNKAKEGRTNEIRKCISCLHCMEVLMSSDITKLPCQCAINIQSGRELDYSNFVEDGDGRTVAIIGAGPAGLEAARVLAMRKFKPVIFEKSDKIGGQLEFANKPPKKEKINWLIDYLRVQNEKLGTEIRLETTPTIEDLKELNPYAVFVAQGSNPIMPKSISGIDGKEVLSTTDILSGKIKLKDKKIGVVGSGMTGLETAELLAETGNEVSLFEMADNIGPGLFFQNLIDIMGRTSKDGVHLYPKHKLIKIENGKLTFELMENNEIKDYSFDNVIISLGTRSNNKLIEEININFDIVKILGDASKPGRIRNAMETGFVNAYNL